MNRLLTIYQHLKSNELTYTLIIFSDADKEIIKHSHEIGYTAYKIWKDNVEKHWDKTSVKQVIKRFEAFGTMERQKCSGRPPTGTTTENEETVREMICSEEDHPGTHVPPKDVAEGLKMSQSSARRMIKRKGIKQFKSLKTPYMNDATPKQRVECAGCLLEKLETNSRMIEVQFFKMQVTFCCRFQ